MAKRRHGDDLRGASRLAIEATQAVTALVEEMHQTIGSGPRVLGEPLAAPMRILTQVVYGTVRSTTSIVGAALDAVLSQLGPLLGEGEPGWEREAVVAALNGVLGDHLAATTNPLATQLQLLLPSALGRRVLVMVHGSGMNERMWRLRAGEHEHGEALARDCGWSVVYVRYNSGLHVSTNGALLAQELGALDADEIAIVGYSMGGLVARAACLYGSWAERLTRLVTIGAPHHGAPLERGGNWFDLLIRVHRYSAPMGKLVRLRSAGITDLRFGSVRDDDWQRRDRFAFTADQRRPTPLPNGARCYAIAGTLSPKAHKRARSDGLVPVASALGVDRRESMTLAFDETVTVPLTSHLELLASAEVYARLRQWLQPSSARSGP